MEYGITITQGIHKPRSMIPEILEDAENELSHISRDFIADLYQQLILKDKKVYEYENKFLKK